MRERFAVWDTPQGVVRLRLHPATEDAIDGLLKSAIPRLAEANIRGKLVVVDGRRIRIRG